MTTQLDPFFRNQSGQTGMKLALALALILSLAALGGAGYLYQLVNSERQDRQALEASQVQFEERAQSLEAEAEHYRSEIEGMRAQVNTLRTERDQLKANLGKNQSEVAGLLAQIKELREQIIVPAPVVESSPPVLLEMEKPATPKIPKVMTVNHKFEFAIINIGGKDNVKMGDKFKVERQGKTIANLKVEKLYDEFSAATIVEELGGATVNEGDSIVRG